MKPGPLGIAGNIETQRRLLDYVQSGRVHPALVLTGPDREVKLAVCRLGYSGVKCSLVAWSQGPHGVSVWFSPLSGGMTVSQIDRICRTGNAAGLRKPNFAGHSGHFLVSSDTGDVKRLA